LKPSQFCRFHVDVVEILAYVRIAPIRRCVLLLWGARQAKLVLYVVTDALRRRTWANLVHYCIERYLALALVYLGVVAVVLPWCLSLNSSRLGERQLSGWCVVRIGVRLRPRPPAEWRVVTLKEFGV